MVEKNFRGLGVALVTPFTTTGAVDFPALDKLVDYLVTNGADYLVALGTTAETATLTEEEKSEVLNHVIRINNNRLPLVLGLGGNNTSAVVKQLDSDLVKQADAILSVTPYYNKPTQEGLYQHYKALARKSPKPIILYNVPGRTGVNMTAETTLRLAHEFENIVAIKEASGDLDQAGAIIKDKPRNFFVISGDDSLTLPLTALGGDGVISVFGNAFPREFSKMIHASLRGDYEEARRYHYQCVGIVPLLFQDGNPAGIKAVLHILGMTENQLRLPLVPASDQTIRALQKHVSAIVKYSVED